MLNADEVQRLRGVVIETIVEQERQGRVGFSTDTEGTIRGGEGDLLSNPSLRHVLLDRRLVEVIGELLGGKPTYFGDSSFRIGKNGVRGWHRDKVGRRWVGGPDWRGSFPVLRCGLYLQDQARHSGGLGVRPGSHLSRRLLPTLPKLVDAQAGDLVVWNMRTVHSAEAVRMRWLPRFPLHPRLQTLLPHRMRVPEDGERIVIFLTFALPGPHFDNYLEYMKSRDFAREAWSHSRFGPEVWAEAESAGWQMLRPIPAYGKPLDQTG
jgi:hypothetical protein